MARDAIKAAPSRAVPIAQLRKRLTSVYKRGAAKAGCRLRCLRGCLRAGGAGSARSAVELQRGRGLTPGCPTLHFSINATTGALTAAVGSPFATGVATTPYSVTVDSSGKFVYVVNNNNDTVLAFSINLTTGALAAVTGGTVATGVSPRSVVTTR